MHLSKRAANNEHAGSSFRLLPQSVVRILLLVTTATAALPAVPEFAVFTGSGAFHAYPAYTPVGASQYAVSDDVLRAVITDLGHGQWRLQLTPLKENLVTVFFPWQSQRAPLDNDIANDIFYYPNLLGRTERAVNRNSDWTWYGSTYPGPAAAPLVVMADPLSAKIIAATNWPPKTVAPLYAAQRMVLRYEDVVPVTDSATYQALIAAVTGNATVGNVPWQKALDLYRSWLDASMGKITYPSWMWEGQGMLNIQLQSYQTIAAVDKVWQPLKDMYPWVLMWGQMSPYPGGSCCGIDPATNRYYPTLPRMDSRFLPCLPQWVQRIVRQGYHAGFYSAPYSHLYGSKPSARLDMPADLSQFVEDIKANRSYGVNSYYLDTFAREYWGQPASIVTAFSAGALPKDAMTEGIVDVYPVPGLVSGALAGGASCGAPSKLPEACAVTTFPPFVRYLLNDRLIYWGESNDDGQFWGLSAPTGCDYATSCANGTCHYGVERQILLTGARIEFRPGRGNPVLDAIISERQRVGWWRREPRYLATWGLTLTGIPNSSRVEISRFEDITGANLLAISNPNMISGLSFELDGIPYAVPARAVAIVEAADVLKQ
ncbi:MAG TPA: hypothetical protein VN442_25345 [Bryobacteraceae bacterium]|nr:hypothetical protein [Bryobacteraceae bacterium]